MDGKTTNKLHLTYYYINTFLTVISASNLSFKKLSISLKMITIEKKL